MKIIYKRINITDDPIPLLLKIYMPIEEISHKIVFQKLNSTNFIKDFT